MSRRDTIRGQIYARSTEQHVRTSRRFALSPIRRFDLLAGGEFLEFAA